MPESDPSLPISVEDLHRSLSEAPYSRALGLEVDSIESNRVRLLLPFAEANSNPGGVLHGGVVETDDHVPQHNLRRVDDVPRRASDPRNRRGAAVLDT
mgnify:CR=1 FL=1